MARQDKTSSSTVSGKRQDSAHSLRVESPDIRAGARIPDRHASKPEGENVAPKIKWSGAPSATNQFAVIVDDPDAPAARPFAHWLVWGIAGTASGLPAPGVVEGKNDFGNLGWGGPRPPQGDGDHHYRFRAFALDAPIRLAPGASRTQLLDAIQGHVLAEGELVGTYSR